MELLSRSERNRVSALCRALQRSGRAVVDIRVLVTQPSHAALARRYDAARAAQMRLPGAAHAKQAALYHTTTCRAASQIADGGFDLSFAGAHGGAFGHGVNLCSTTDQALLYTFQRRRACTLVCRGAVGRCYANCTATAPGAARDARTVRRLGER